MSSQSSPDGAETLHIELRNRNLAAFLAWLWPGAGHIYQQRYGKGALFMVCIVGTFFFGMSIGQGHVVYASFEKHNFRWQYVPQAFAGLPALPALVQRMRVNQEQEPIGGWNAYWAPPNDPTPREPNTPPGSVLPADDDLHFWHRQLGNAFELGTLYTVVAGLLNVLAIYDAFAGPFLPAPESEPSTEKKKKSDSEGGST